MDFHMMVSREDAVVEKDIAGMIMMVDMVEAHIKAHPVAEMVLDYGYLRSAWQLR